MDANGSKQALHDWYDNHASTDEAAVARAVERNRALRAVSAAQFDDGAGPPAAPDAAARARIEAIREWGTRPIE